MAGDIDVKTPGSIRLQGEGSVAEMTGPETEFVTFVWRSNADFEQHQNILPEAVTEVSEVVIRAGYSDSPAEVVADTHTTVGLSLGEESGSQLTWKMVWTSTDQGAYSMDGLTVGLEAPLDVAAIRLSSFGGDGRTFRGWSRVEILLGRPTGGGMRVGAAAPVVSASGTERSESIFFARRGRLLARFVGERLLRPTALDGRAFAAPLAF